MSASTKPQAVPLSAVATIDNRKSVGFKPYVGLEDISNDTGAFLGSLEPRAVKSATFAFDGRHVLYGRLRAYLNKALTPDFEGHCSTEIFPILPSEKLNRRYLFYWLTWRPTCERISATGTGARMPRASMHEVMEFEIPLPPLEEQKRIVAVLDQAFAALDRARALTEANLADAGELFEAAKRHFSTLGAEDAEEVSLGDVVAITSKLVDPKLPENLDLPHIGAGNMVSGTDELIEIQTAREEGLKSGKFPFAAGVVLYSKIRPYLRKVARPGFDGLCSADVYPLTASKRIDPDYLFHLLLSEDFTTYAIAGSARAGMPKVNQDHLFAYRFQLPPVESQRVIAERIDAALPSRKALETLMKAKETQISDLRQSLLLKAFAGELT